LGQTALHLAVGLGATEIVEILLSAGAKVNALNSAGKNPVQLAVKNGDELVFMLLLKSGADLQSRDPGGNNLLHLACAGTEPARERLVKAILKHNVSVNERNFSDYTPLHIAVTSGSRALIDLLLAAGARIDARLPDGRSALFICRHEFIGYLLDRNADSGLKSNDGRTAFVEALLSQDRERIAAFKASGHFGVEPKAFRIGNEDVTLWEAAASGNLAQLRGILQAEASQVQLREVQFGETALHRAVLAERAAAVELLLAAGAQPSAGNHLWRTPLHYGAATGNLAVVKMLVEAGSNVFALDARGSTPLHEAAAARHTEVYEFLLRNGAIDSTRNNNGLSAADMLK
jgi:ankyrin repeat protein